jgi:hypothetical protein
MAGRTVMGAVGAAADAADERFLLEFQVAGGAWERGPLSSCGDVRFEEALPVRPLRFEKGLRSFAGQLQWHDADHSLANQKGPRRSRTHYRAEMPVTGHQPEQPAGQATQLLTYNGN